MVKCFVIHNNHLISCSLDREIKIWDLNSHKMLHTFDEHTAGVNKMIIKDNFLFSTSDDNTMK